MNRLARFLALFLWCSAALALEVPFLSGRVTDNAEILSAGARERITQTLKAHEEATTNQIAVLTIPSLEGGTVEEFAAQVFEAWKLGKKGKDNGVLLLIAPKDRRLRIEVGYGLEGPLTDVTASRIIRNVITPRFKANDYDGGVEQGVVAIIGAIKGEAVASESVSANGESESSFFKGPDIPLTERILLGAFIFGIIGLFTVIGVLTPGAGWFLYVFLIPFWAMFPIVVVGPQGALWILGSYLLGFPVAKLICQRQPWYIKAGEALRSKGRANVGGWVITSGGSSSGGFSSSSSSGGFSGGGGSSGGGGASGSW